MTKKGASGQEPQKSATTNEKFEPTREQHEHVLALAGFGLTQDQIRLLVKHPATGKPINRRTLAKCFAHELEAGKATAIAAVAQSLYQKATGRSATAHVAAIFFLKAQAGWKDRHEISGPDGGPVQVESPGVRIAKRLDAIADRFAKMAPRPKKK